MNEDRYRHRMLASSCSSSTVPPVLMTISLAGQNNPAAKVDAALERLQLHLTYGPYAGWKDTIRQDVETVLEAWREYRREQGASA